MSAVKKYVKRRHTYIEIPMLKVSYFQNDFWMSSFEPKTNENISLFLPYLSKIGQIKKRMQNIILEINNH